MYPTIESLGECRVLSPLRHIGPGAAKFKIDSERILCDDRSKDNVEAGTALPSPLTFEVAGPRERIYFDPGQTIAAVVSCGGLCPGRASIGSQLYVVELVEKRFAEPVHYECRGKTVLDGYRLTPEGALERQRIAES